MAIVSVPESELRRVAATSVMPPVRLFVPVMFRIAPALVIPFPEIDTDSAMASPVPSNSSTAPEETLVPPATLPSAVLLCRRITPTAAVVVPA